MALYIFESLMCLIFELVYIVGGLFLYLIEIDRFYVENHGEMNNVKRSKFKRKNMVLNFIPLRK